jgi:abortive infection alpha-like protein
MGRKRQQSTSNAFAKVEASAKVGASAKYVVKRTIKQIIPEDVTRAKAGAWLTLISPITQWAGLKADELAHKRELLRLQQEETLAEIAVRASSRLKALPANGEPVPMKFIVPFLEKASLENADSDLIDLWANLLVSAAEHYNPHYVHFANIISQMSAQQARVFTGIVGTDDSDKLELELGDLYTEFLPDCMQVHLKRCYTSLRKA